MQIKSMRYGPQCCLIIVVCLLFMGSCKKYLDKKQNDTLVTPSSLSDFQALLDDDNMVQTRTPSYGEASTDEYFLTPTVYNSRPVISQQLYTWQYWFTQGSASDWSYCYQPVYTSNLVLDLIKNIPRSPANKIEWNNVMGSALFYRSYYFLCLLWNYAKAYDSTTADKDWGIALRTTSDFNVTSVRATNKDSYNQVLNDTKASIPMLPDYPQVVFRPSKAAAYGLLARCYLSMRDYKSALLYADSCIQLNNKLMDFNGDEDINGSLTASSPFLQFNKEIIFYTEMNALYTTYRSSYGRIDTVLYKSYSDNDLRKAAFFKANADGYQTFKGSYAIYSTASFSGIATDEMYLIRAECNIRLGHVQSGLSDLDTLLNKRYKTNTFIPYTGLSQKDALDLVLQEREKELIMRGMRWMDLKRLKKEGANITLERVEDDGVYTLQPNANFYALPIPEDIIQLTGMPQNDL